MNVQFAEPAPEAAAAAERGMPPWVPDPDC